MKIKKLLLGITIALSSIGCNSSSSSSPTAQSEFLESLSSVKIESVADTPKWYRRS